jgi:hypothetical protein
MTDDNIITDISDRLPPEVRRPWRRKLPESYAKHIDELLTMQRDVRAMQKRLAEIKDAIDGAADGADHWSAKVGVKLGVDSISEAIVLLKCAGQTLTYTVPTEEYMPKESIREFWK